MTRTPVTRASIPLPPDPPVYWTPGDLVGVGPVAPSGTGMASPLEVTTKSGEFEAAGLAAPVVGAAFGADSSEPTMRNASPSKPSVRISSGANAANAPTAWFIAGTL